MSLSRELAALMRSCDAHAIANPKKAARNISNTGIYLVGEIEQQRIYALHWLLHVRGEGKSFDDNKRSNQNLSRHITELNLLGYTEVFPDDPGFEIIWEAIAAACRRLGTAPSNRTNGPDWTGRRFFAPLNELNALLNVSRIDQSAAKVATDRQNAFQDRISKSQYDEASARRKRLREASRQPGRTFRVVESFHRNPDVIAERLHLAQGTCDSCLAPAPFNRAKDGSPFLEVHHAIPLADGGEDSVENTRALCPNCHRKAHFG